MKENTNKKEEVFIIGGESLYNYFINYNYYKHYCKTCSLFNE